MENDTQVLDPAVADPAVVDPAVVDPAVVDPAVVEPAATETVDPVAEEPLDPITGAESGGYSNTSNGNQVAVNSYLDYSTNNLTIYNYHHYHTTTTTSFRHIIVIAIWHNTSDLCVSIVCIRAYHMYDTKGPQHVFIIVLLATPLKRPLIWANVFRVPLVLTPHPSRACDCCLNTCSHRFNAVSA